MGANLRVSVDVAINTQEEVDFEAFTGEGQFRRCGKQSTAVREVSSSYFAVKVWYSIPRHLLFDFL